MSILLCITLLLAVEVEPFVPNESLLKLYTSGEYVYDGKSQFVVRYRLYSPPATEAGEKYPLLIWLHGFGDAGHDNKEHLRWLDLVVKTALDPNYFCLALQCPEGEMWYRVPDKVQADDLITITVALLDQLASEKPIDQERVYVSGVSSGGNACWEIAMRYPDRFAAVAPLSSGGGDLSRLDRITKIPIWAFNSETDSMSPAGAQQRVEALNALDGNAHLTIVNNRKLGLKLTHTPGVLVDHDSWTAACEHYHLVEWLFAQRRGVRSTPPGIRPLAWWNYLPIAIVPLVAILVWRSVRSRGQRQSRNVQPVERYEPGSGIAPSSVEKATTG